MNGPVLLVARREISVRARSKGFLWSTAAFVVLIVGGIVLASVLQGQSERTFAVGLTSETGGLAASVEAVAEARGLTATVSETDQGSGEAALRDGELDALLTGTPRDQTVVVHEDLDPALRDVFTAVAQQGVLDALIRDLGGDPRQIGEEVSLTEPTLRILDEGAEVHPGQAVVGMVGGILLFVSLLGAGQLVAQGVVEEKTSRVVEILLSTIRPWQLMAGKVLGLGVVGLIQLGLIVGTGSIALAATDLLGDTELRLGGVAVWVVLWFLVGYASYALLLAALAALVSRQEEVGSITAPVTTLMMVPYIVGVTIAPWEPDNPLVVALSFIPFTSPLVMPVRFAAGDVSVAESLAALGVSVAVLPLLTWVAGRIYRSAVLNTGSKVRLLSALRAG